MIECIKGFWKVKYMFIGMCPLSSYCVILSTSSRTANAVECFFLKPY